MNPHLQKNPQRIALLKGNTLIMKRSNKNRILYRLYVLWVIANLTCEVNVIAVFQSKS